MSGGLQGIFARLKFYAGHAGVTLRSSDGSDADALAIKITVSGGVTYIGEAAPGSAQASAVWRCSAIDASGNVTWADGDSNFDNIATNLPGLTYS